MEIQTGGFSLKRFRKYRVAMLAKDTQTKWFQLREGLLHFVLAKKQLRNQSISRFTAILTNITFKNGFRALEPK